MRRRTLLGGVSVVAMVGIGSAGALADSMGASNVSATEAEPEAHRSTAAVVRGDLTAEQEFRAAVSFGDTWSPTTDLAGTVTDHHPIGHVVALGGVLVRVDDQPLFLAEGAMPMYRELRRIDTRFRDENGDRLTLQEGFDVAQLQYFLVQAGFDADGAMTVDGTFGKSTETAVEEWQESVGLSPTGRIDNSQIVFSPDAVRIASAARVGDRFSSLEVNNAKPAVLVDTSNRDRGAFTVGAVVDVELANEGTRPGTVDKQEQVTAQDGSTVWRTTILADGELPGATTTATVTAHRTVASDALIVPVSALLALAEGGFAVEVITETGSVLTAVEVGEVLDGQAEVEGNLENDDRVVVAG